MSLNPQEVEDLFQQGLIISPGAAREEWLARVCGERSDLRSRLSRLLAAASPTNDFLERPLLPTLPVVPSLAGLALDVLPEHVGRYRILEILGKGGMGVVCRAEQTEPVQRQVALKLIRPGVDSERIVARFEAERQSLALMDHTNIARVLDAGATSDGRPWFAMELVTGQSITEYCDSHRLTTEERLSLLIPVCQAVQHAHQKGIIHRDLKPGNILIADLDGVPVPKVIDFGVAKAIGSANNGAQLTTGSGVVVGTMEYMSPEQAGLNQQDVDTRTDVYSLGVVMYELLTGSPPFSRAEYPDGNLFDLLRRIQEQEPTRPSEKLSTAEALTGLADRRRSEPRQLTGIVRGELDWIVLRALEKDREQRYCSMAEFAADIQRFLSGEIVVAAPPGKIYRFRKLWKRHRFVMNATSAVVVSLMIGMIGASWGMFTARASAEAEKAARVRETEQRRNAEAVADFLVEDILALTTREGQLRFDSHTLTRNARLQDLLERAAVRLDHRKLDDAIAADLHWIIGVSQRASGDPRSAVPHLEKSVLLLTRTLGPDHERTFNARHSLGVSLHGSGELLKAQQLQKELLDDLVRVQGKTGIQSLYAMHALAETCLANDRPLEARALLKDAVTGFRNLANPDEQSLLNAELSLALACERCGETEDAISQLRDVAQRAGSRLGSDHSLTLRSQEELAMSLYYNGQREEALELLDKVVPALVEKIGETHPAALAAQSDRAVVIQGMGRLSEAVPMLQRVLNERRRILAPDHRDLMVSELNLAVALNDSGHAHESIAMLEPSLERLMTKFGPDHLLTLLCLHHLGDAFSQIGQSEKALEVLDRSIQGRTRRYGAEHAQTLISLGLKGRCLQRQGRFDEATAILEKVLECRRRDQGPDHLDTLVAATNLAAAYRLSGRTAEAIQVAESAVETGRRSLGSGHTVVVSALNNLAVAYWREKRLDRSIPLFEEVVRLRDAVDPLHPDCLMACANLGVNYRDAGRIEEAVELLRRADRRRFQSADLGWVHNELRALCLATGQSDRLAQFLIEDLQQYRSEYGDSAPIVALHVLQGTLELFDSSDTSGAARLLGESRSLFQPGQVTDEFLYLFNALDTICRLRSAAAESAATGLTQVLDWLEVHEDLLSPSSRQLFLQASEHVVEELESRPDEQARWKEWLSRTTAAPERPVR